MRYKVPFVDYPKQYRELKNEINSAVMEVFERGDFILRNQVEKCEENIASFLGTKYAVGVNSGTDAIQLSLKAAGIGPGHEVITVAHTFVATVAAIIHCGATPVLIDIGDDHNMNVDLLEKAITSRTKAIIPVHLNGRLCDMEKLTGIASRYNLIIIEDAAQALGASFDGQKAGSFGLAGCFSFYPAKILGGAGDGGIAVTNDENIAKSIRLLRDHGQDRETNDIVFYGYNSRLDNLQAAIINVKFKYLPQWIERRRELANLYQHGLSDLPQIKLPHPPLTQGRYFDVFTNYVIQSHERNKLVAHLRDSGIEILVSWPKPMHHQKALGLSQFQLPKTEQISQQVLSVPLLIEITDEQVEYVITSIHKFFENNKPK